MTTKYVYYFGEGDLTNKMLLGGKGCGLGTMKKIGLPVPPGYTITSEACIYQSTNKKRPEGLNEQIKVNMDQLQDETKKRFGYHGDGNLLLLSVRSGAAISMPGMMDTVLNLGLNDNSVINFAKATNNERFAWDSYRRFIAMFGDVVLGVPHEQFERAIGALKKRVNVEFDTDLTVSDLKSLVNDFKKVIIDNNNGQSFPQDPWQQLDMAIDAVFDSWDNDRAIHYREMNGIPHSMGTAVNVQAMVFGNMGDTSGTGVAFTRSPTTGEAAFYGEYLVNAQGEDVVAGIRTPQPIAEMEKKWPLIYKELSDAFHLLEKHYKEMQDCEFTIENGKLYMLQTRKGKRTANAALKIAVDMHNEGLMTKEEAILAVEPKQIDQLLHKQLDPIEKKKAKLLATGLPASPGAAVGVAVFTAAKALEYDEDPTKPPTVLIRLETSPEDIRGMNVCQGVLTARGGMTSHAAVVARGMGRCCVAGCGDVEISQHGDNINECKVGNKLIKEGDWITLDGSTGEVLDGKVGVEDPKLHGNYEILMGYADSIRLKYGLAVRTNADTPEDASKARSFGAQGIGLVRTEHQYFQEDRINVMRRMILTKDNAEHRNNALKELKQFQQDDFVGLFKAMDNLPVIIRLLDPPLHEFLPHEDKDIEIVANNLGINVTVKSLKDSIESMKETNPMLGFRGCRLGVVIPEIYKMQIEAIFNAAVICKTKFNVTAIPEIEVPLVGNIDEFRPICKLVHEIAEQTGAKKNNIPYKVGTMLEIPRACLKADELAKECDFMSFGTNDLTQMTMGFSRDDAGSFLKDYVRKGIYTRDPFQSIDQEGVGMLMKVAVSLARSVKPDIDIGICGEHGGDAASVEFCHKIGLSNVSCSPYRVPIARLAAAQAVIKHGLQPKKIHLTTDVFGLSKL